MTAELPVVSCASRSAIVALTGSSFAGSVARDRWLVRPLETFLDRVPAHGQMAFDFTDRPPLFRARALGQTKEIVFARRLRGGRFAHRALQDKDLGGQPSCCLQGRGGAGAGRTGDRLRMRGPVLLPVTGCWPRQRADS
jgi:hypothetical protein